MAAKNEGEVLARIPLFAGLSPVERQALAGRAVEKRYQAGELLFIEGDPCPGLYVIVEGRVKIYKTAPSGREIMLAIEEGPSTVAEVPLFDGGPFPASVIALNDVRAWLIYKEDFHQVCRRNPELSLKVLAVVGRRLRGLVGLVESVTFGSVRQRLARAILELAEGAGGDTFRLPVTQEELAARLGTVREVVSRNLSRFQAEGLLQIERRKVVVLDRAGLEHEAETEW
ncbi:MAG: Crp/Fnr family transcriptional regulator [Bryobacteraceae bacterium]